MRSLPRFALTKDLRRGIGSGHPWIFDRALSRKRVRVAPGELVHVTYDGESIAVGYADPGCPIAVRVLDIEPATSIDTAWVTRRARAAAHCRVVDPRLGDTDAVRVIHGENDYMPGLVIDTYRDTAVVSFDSPGACAFWAARFAGILDGLRTAGMGIRTVLLRRGRHRGERVEKRHRQVTQTARDLGYQAPPDVIRVYEGDARFDVDVRHGHKTGLFLDQRDNRRLVGRMAANARVLDVFSYTGAFSVHAALGGARQVTAIDISAPAMEAARQNFVASGLSTREHRFLAIDAFEFLETSFRRGARYDMVIVDPPSFAPNEKAKKNALDAYRRLNRLALQLVEPGGFLMTASCSSHVTTADSLRVLAGAARACARTIRVTDIRGAATDHPTIPGFPEGNYLSFVVVAVE